MKIQVHFGDLMAGIFGRDREEITLPAGSTIRDLLILLAAEHGEDFRKLVMTEGGQVRPLARILADGQDVAQLGGIDVNLEGIPRVTIVISLPYIAGG